jgi:hypothetical protein
MGANRDNPLKVTFSAGIMSWTHTDYLVIAYYHP